MIHRQHWSPISQDMSVGGQKLWWRFFEGPAGIVALMRIDEHVLVSEFLRALDLIGTFVFALSGAVSGVKHRIDLFGVLVLSFAAATAGGIVRDVLIGAIPPAAIQDWRYLYAIAGCWIRYLLLVVAHRQNEEPGPDL